MKKKINIGITFVEHDYKKGSFFSNGIMQNVVSLRELFEKCKNVNKSYMINTTNEKPEYAGTVWEKYGPHIISKEEAKKKCDLIVVCQGSLHIDEYAEYVKMGKKIVKQTLGAELALFIERTLFEVPVGGIYKQNEYVSAVWMSPHFFERDRSFYESIYNCKIYKAPYIWTPKFIEEHIKVFQEKIPSWSGTYTPSGAIEKRISVMEPNLNVVKTCVIPLVAAEFLERRHPEALKYISIFGGNHIKTKQDMVNYVSGLKIYKNKKCFFESRYPIVWTLKDNTDIVLSHQNQCELNYLYLDASWMGYPVVHNSPMMKELGWYYPENNTDIAVKHLEYIAKNFDENEYKDEKYLKKSREYASQFLPDNPKNIKGYEKLIESVMGTKTSASKKVKKKIAVTRDCFRFGDHMMAAFFTQLLNDNGFDAVYHLDNGIKNNVNYCHVLDVPVGTNGEKFNFRYNTDDTPFVLSDKNFIYTAIRYFKEWANYDGELVIKTPYVPIKFKEDSSVQPVDVVMVTDVGSYAITKKWPYFDQLKKMLEENNISYVDLNDFGKWTNDEKLLNKVNNLLYTCKVFVGLDTGSAHYATGILAKKSTKNNFIIQSGFNLFSHWASQYKDLFYPIENKQTCAPCVLPDPNKMFLIPQGVNLAEKCNKKHECMRGIAPEQVFAYIVNSIKG